MRQRVWDEDSIAMSRSLWYSQKSADNSEKCIGGYREKTNSDHPNSRSGQRFWT